LSGIKSALKLARMAKLQIFPPWWLEVGTEVCSNCDHMYVYETEHRCAHCDGAVCSNCYEPTSSTCHKCGKQEQESSIDIDL